MSRIPAKVTASYTNATWTCGLGIVGNFSTENRNPFNTSLPRPTVQEAHSHNYDNPRQPIQRGTGYVVAGFINDVNCRRAYEKIKNNFPILFQSEVRVNRNSLNRFFFIVYDTR